MALFFSMIIIYVVGSILYITAATLWHIVYYPRCCDHCNQSEFFCGSKENNNGKPWIDYETHRLTVFKKHTMLAAMFPLTLLTMMILFIFWCGLRLLVLFYDYREGPNGKTLYNTFGIEKLTNDKENNEILANNNNNNNNSNSDSNELGEQKSRENTKANKNNKKKIGVGIIGGGPSGLITLKELLEFSDVFDVTLFEQHKEIGGTFANSYKNGWLTSSNTITQFSWFISKDNLFWSFDDYVKYLKEFVSKFDLIKYIKLGTRVDNANYDSNRKLWHVRVNGDASKVYEFEHLIVCCGIAHIPRIPANILECLPKKGTTDEDWTDVAAEEKEREKEKAKVEEKEDLLKTKVIHSTYIRDFDIFKGKRVLCVGLGESGSDVSYNICRVCESLDLITRHGAGFVLPRFTGGIATDIDTSYAYQICRNWATWWPYTIKRKFESYYFTPYDNVESLNIASGVNRQMIKEMINKHKVDPRLIFNRFKTKSTMFTLAIQSKKMNYKQSAIKSIKYDNNNGEFLVKLDEDENKDKDPDKEYNYDMIVCCTGFDSKFSFLTKDNEIIYDVNKKFDEAMLYKNVFDPKLGKIIAFIGYARPIIGSLIPLSELVARYVTMVLLPNDNKFKSIDLPNKEEMISTVKYDIMKKEEMMRYDFLQCKKRKRNLIDFLTYINEITELLGSKNNFWTLFIYYPISLWWQIICGQIQSMHFRIFSRYNRKGQFSSDYIRQSLKDSPLMPLPVLVIELWVYAIFYVTKRLQK